jgi:hypothetical protein
MKNQPQTTYSVVFIADFKLQFKKNLIRIQTFCIPGKLAAAICHKSKHCRIIVWSLDKFPSLNHEHLLPWSFFVMLRF